MLSADDDFVISDDEVDLGHLSSEESESGGRKRRGSEDSDFVLDDDDSGSDWDAHKKAKVCSCCTMYSMYCSCTVL